MSKIVIIAEAGISHGGDMNIAKELILRAKEAGADTWKTQLYDVDTLFPDKIIMAQGRNWYEEVKKTQLSKEQTFQLAEWCKEAEIEFLASAYDTDRVLWLEEIGVKRHKIGCKLYYDELSEWEQEIGETVLEMCWTGKPIIMSVPYGEVRPQLPTEAPCYYSYCIPEYPAPLNKFQFSKVNFDGHEWDGLSDHSVGLEASMIAMARGAQIIEKHFCLRRDNSNPDMICSIEPYELKQLVEFAKRVEEVL